MYAMYVHRLHDLFHQYYDSSTMIHDNTLSVYMIHRFQGQYMNRVVVIAGNNSELIWKFAP